MKKIMIVLFVVCFGTTLTAAGFEGKIAFKSERIKPGQNRGKKESFVSVSAMGGGAVFKALPQIIKSEVDNKVFEQHSSNQIFVIYKENGVDVHSRDRGSVIRTSDQVIVYPGLDVSLKGNQANDDEKHVFKMLLVSIRVLIAAEKEMEKQRKVIAEHRRKIHEKLETMSTTQRLVARGRSALSSVGKGVKNIFNRMRGR